MKNMLLVLLMALVLSSGVAVAQTSDSASAVVTATVAPNVGVAYSGGTVKIAVANLGPFSGEIVYRVDANTQLIDLWVQVSNLYKDGVATSLSQIPVLVAPGVQVTPATGERQPFGVANTPLPYLTGDVSVGGFIGLETEKGRFGSGTAGHFSETVTVVPSWDLKAETPIGDYSGNVVLWAMVVP